MLEALKDLWVTAWRWRHASRDPLCLCNDTPCELECIHCITTRRKLEDKIDELEKIMGVSNEAACIDKR